ncbi:phosphorylase family protein [Sphingomonas abietis]|uniref:Phosphorylase n=1 Tax=Sphingomonas abietis TaxID=3012344 RepID=A0ABY7NSL0_9SPHN|nr:phosphorylase [Sphingomonas abietis]WBO24529.1 phosphorylase [Sphingomonas abietis]
MILIATGMKREAKALARDGVTVVTAGTDAARLEAELEAGVAAGATAILSMGLAGALAPLLNVGDWVVGTLSPIGMERREWSVGAGSSRPKDRLQAADLQPAGIKPVARKDGSRDWISRIAKILPGAVVGRIHADGAMVVTAAQKEQYHFSERALACDMESHIAAAVARRHGLPFAVARVISDSAHRTLPRAAQVAMAPDGGVRIGAVLLAILSRPWQLPALIGVGLDAGRAMRRLVRGYDMLAGAGFVLGDQRQLPLDMA